MSRSVSEYTSYYCDDLVTDFYLSNSFNGYHTYVRTMLMF